MKIGIISDTHDSYEGVKRAVEILRQRQVEYVFHAGDIVSPFTARAFSAVEKAKFVAVFGNNDGEKILLSSTIRDFGGEIHDESYSGVVQGRRIFMIHRPGVVEAVAQSGKYDLVIYGHTHRPDIRKAGETLIVNPGESTSWLTGKAGLVLMDLTDMSVQQLSLA